MSNYISNGVNAAINCPLKKSTIAWARCEQYRGEFNCLCHEARDRLKIKGQGRETFEALMRRVKRPHIETPPGWSIERMTRFYVINDNRGETVHRATNQKEAEDYLHLVARLQALEDENRQLWAILREELVEERPRIELAVNSNLFEDEEPSPRIRMDEDDEDDDDDDNLAL